MKTRLFLISTIFVWSMGILMTGCQKDKTTNQQQPWDKNSAENSSVTAMNTFDGLNSLADQAISSNNLKSLKLGACPVINLNISQLPYILTFDWGTGCTGQDGITRSGKITLSLSGLMNVAGKVATFTFTDFYSNGTKITGAHSITYAGLNPGNNWPRFDVHTNAQLLFSDNTSITYLSDNSRLLAEGAGTLSWTDDVWHIIGTASGKTRAGINWSAAITNDIVKKNSCNWFDSGSLVVTPIGGLARTINFGDGTCDNKAILTIGGQTINIEM